MPKFAVFDTVVLKTDKRLIGVVERIQNETYDPLQDCLIIAHVQVDTAVLNEFMTTGTPPRSHLYVRFADEAQGSSLVCEDDIVLLDRSFTLGEIVKQDGQSMLGTIVNVVETYTLQPAWNFLHSLKPGVPFASLQADAVATQSHVCDEKCPLQLPPEIDHPLPHTLLHKIPAYELRRVEDVMHGDYVVTDEWLGMVEEMDVAVILLLSDFSVVVVGNPDELYVPVPETGKPLVSFPEFDDLSRPDPLVAQQGWSATIPPDEFKGGTFVITNHRNLRLGRWLRGQYNTQIPAHGYILDVRNRSIHVQWLSCNAFIPQRPTYISQPERIHSLYENLNTFPKRSELRRNKQLSILDHNRLPWCTENRLRNKQMRDSRRPDVMPHSEFRVGDHVRFRDPAGAAVKYQGEKSHDNDTLHGKFVRHISADWFGFDMNELKIISSEQEVTVLWQDGTSTKHLSRTLGKFPLFESDLVPSDLVVAREGMKQQPALESGGRESIQKSISKSIDFNEMTYFERAHDLLPAKVGVIQNVDASERVAQVRWFTKPEIRLLRSGHMLGSDSRFGKLSDTVEDVSLYEVMTFPALMRKTKDLILIAPSRPFIEAQGIIESISASTSRQNGCCALSLVDYLVPDELGRWLQSTARGITVDSSPWSETSMHDRRDRLLCDWMGEIVGIGLDGVVTVRLNMGDVCRDILIEHDQVIAIIDDAALPGPLLHNDPMDVDSDDESFAISEDMSAISEDVEYEGGERLDEDSDDENWNDTDDEFERDKSGSTSSPVKEKEDSAMSESLMPRESEADSQISAPSKTDESITHVYSSGYPGSLVMLESSVSDAEPPSFDILSQEPPPDQYQSRTHEVGSSSTFLKRIAKEHRTLNSALPKGEIYVRTYENRLDLLRCLIIGPADTPYEFSPFLIDLQLPARFPRDPPLAHFHSWTSGLGRINPNLYEEGKICLSLLGTWPGKGETEGWSDKATILQLLVSLQGLVFVRQPFYNEAGFEDYIEDPAYDIESHRYNEKAFVMARAFIKHAVSSPVVGMEDVLARLYLPRLGNNSPNLLQKVTTRANQLIKKSEHRHGTENEELLDGEGSPGDRSSVFLRPLSRGAVVMLRRTIRDLEGMMSHLAEAARTTGAESTSAQHS